MTLIRIIAVACFLGIVLWCVYGEGLNRSHKMNKKIKFKKVVKWDVPDEFDLLYLFVTSFLVFITLGIIFNLMELIITATIIYVGIYIYILTTIIKEYRKVTFIKC
jgi:phosphatidylserine synthase